MLDRRSILKMAAGSAMLTLIPSAQLQAKTPGKRLAMVFDVRRWTKTNEQDAVQQLWIIPEPSTQLMVISAESELNDGAISVLILGRKR